MRSRYKLDPTASNTPYFVTSTIVEWLPVFTHKDHFDPIIASLDYCRTQKAMKLYAYVILENHLHLCVSAPDLSGTMRSFKSFTSKKLIESIEKKGMHWLLNQLAFFKAKHKQESDYQVWQEGYHPEKIVDMGMMRQKIEYLHHNPVRRGYVAKSADWLYSSAGQLLEGRSGMIELDPLPAW